MVNGPDNWSVTDSLAAHLNDRKAGSAHLEHAMRFLIAQWSDYKTADDMTAELVRAGVTPDAIQAATSALSSDSALLEEAALDVLSAAWADPDLHQAARDSLDEAATRLPVVEVATIAVAAMYGLWLLTTRGRRRTTRTVRSNTDGAYEETETTEWYDAAGPLRAVVDLIRPAGPLGAPDSTEVPQLPEGGPKSNGDEHTTHN